MATLRYRAIIKVLCNECQTCANMKRRFDVNCRGCSHKKYNNVNNLLNFTSFLHKEFPNWVWMNVYEYKKNENGVKLASYQKGKNEPTSISV